MKIGFLLILLATVLLFGGTVAAQGGRQQSKTEQLEKLVSGHGGGYILVDVRTAGEYNGGYIPSAINIPHTVIGNNLPTQDRSTQIVLYCRSGIRSNNARQTLEKLGFTNILDFGGIGSWQGSLDKPE